MHVLAFPLLRCVRLAVLGALLAVPAVQAQSDRGQVDPERIDALIEAWKEDPRGPYAGIRWFCPDGSVIPAQQRCESPGGIQHAILKPEAERLREAGLYLGQILAGTDEAAFWDAAHHHSRLKQYQLGTYLYTVDDGWILRRAQSYRGAFQAEDEARWGRSFLTQMLRDDARVRSHFFLLRQAARDLPHGTDDNVQQRIRATSTDVANRVPDFMPIRVKIHGQPGPEDLERVRAFRQKHGDTLGEEARAALQTLERDLASVYEVSGAERLSEHVAPLPASEPVTRAAQAVVDAWPSLSAAQRVRQGSELLLRLRRAITDLPPEWRSALLDLSIALEDELLRGAGSWTADTPRALLEKGAALAQAAAGSGFLELWEWDRVSARLDPPADATVPRETFDVQAEALRRVAEWGSAMVTAHYEAVVDRYAAFEPKARGFIDDRVRASVLLPLGEVASRLGAQQARYAGRQHRVMGLDETAGVRGGTPGVAAGTLRVVTGDPHEVAFEEDEIYVLSGVPNDLSPVAGLGTTTEGTNVVSHVQLLARNLGIPTAAFSETQVEALARHDGTRVFLAVTPGGTVRLVRADAMTDEERALVEEDVPDSGLDDGSIRVPLDALDFSHDALTSLQKLRSADAGRIVGPKAANLGQLKSLFPDRVAPGFVVPFGVFRTHMNQPMPGTDGSYWSYLQATFQGRGGPGDPATPTVQRRLDTLRTAIRDMPLSDSLRTALQAQLRRVMGAPVGDVGVFVRSDTNMEDLPGFTGAGLNLTVPNVVGAENLFDAVRRVWASPYTERSVRWRQRVLDTPEHVYPSVLIQKSVPVEASGVLVTTGVAEGPPDALTASFSRGVGGAVEGEATEVTLLRPDGGDHLVSPLREPAATVLPPGGGTDTEYVTFERPVLMQAHRDTLRRIADRIREQMPDAPGIGMEGPYDVELGFRGTRPWLFQVRPFVEADRARTDAYFRQLDARAEPQSTVDLTASLPN